MSLREPCDIRPPIPKTDLAQTKADLSVCRHGWVNPKDVEDLWLDQFNYFYREYDEFVYPVTVHPDVSGHPHALMMLER